MSTALDDIARRAARGAGCLVAIAAVALAGCRSVGERDLPPGTPALHRAAAFDDVSSVQQQLAQDPDPRGPFGWTPLHYAAIHDALEVARLLLDRGAQIDALDHTSMTPLHWAARRGHDRMVDLLLSRRAEVMARTLFDSTPLHEARTVAVAQILLSKGAEIEARNLDGMTPLHTAATQKVAQFLIGKGANLNARAKDGRTPMDMPPMPLPRLPK